MEVTGQKSTLSSAQLRKIKKPIIERRRRERINDSLNQLKSLLLEAMDKDESRHSKMEKADILELAVEYLKTTQSSNSPLASADDVNLLKYHSGYKACAEEVGRYLNKVQGINPQVTNRLAGHLSSRLGVRQPMTSFSEVQQQHSPECTPVTSLPGNSIRVETSQGPQAALPLYITAVGQMCGVHVLSPVANHLTLCPVPANGHNELANVAGLSSPNSLAESPEVIAVSPNKETETRDTNEKEAPCEGHPSKSMWRPW